MKEIRRNDMNKKHINKKEQLFQEHCRKMKVTEQGRKMNLRKLNKLSSDEEVQIKIIQQSLEHNWRGFYPFTDE